MMKNKGFTLVELIVAVGLFTIVMFIATGALLSIVNLNKKAQAQQSAINNINFAIENMARSIRTGSGYRGCDNGSNPPSRSGTNTSTNDCTSGGSTLVFSTDNSSGSDTGYWSYWLENGQIMKATNINCNTGNCLNIYAVTAPEITIESLKFYVYDSANRTTGGDSNQARVVIVVKGYAFVNTNSPNPRRVDFNLETTASQRRVDL